MASPAGFEGHREELENCQAGNTGTRPAPKLEGGASSWPVH